ncbi:hypothetical protein ABIB25_004589 [Nakamurella sp. UYEF19]|uniref:hypothetical protein n=1 Tax=Nakamurella sp. UYEF19 TaxID=1756392 RepID=UPI003396766D
MVGLLLAVGVGAVLVKTKTLRIGSTSADSGVSNAAITLPATVGGFTDIVEAEKALRPGSAQATKVVTFRKETEAKVEALTKAAYEKAYPGAAVAYRSYGTPDLMLLVAVIAVRAPSPGLTLGPVADPAILGVAVLPQQIKIFGEVQCEVVQQQTTVAGKPVDPDNVSTVLCQRSGAKLTVRVSGGVFHGPAEQQQMIALTNAVWTALGG